MKKKPLLKRIYTERPGEDFLIKQEAWSTKIGRIFGIPLARALAKSPIRIHPNIISILSIPFAVLAGFFFFKNMLIYGAIFFFISFILDNTDGVLARLTNTTSQFGHKLDTYTDRLNNFVMFFGLWYSQYYINDQWFIGGSIFAVHYFIMFIGLFYIKSYKYKTVFPGVISYYHPLDEGFLTFFVAPLTGFFIYIFPVLVILQYISHIVLFIKQR